MLSRVRSLAIGTLALVIAGCSHTPTYEFSQYRNAFVQVQTVSEDVLIDFAEAKESAEARLDVQDPSGAGTPAFFSTELEYDGDKQPDDIEVRRTAFRVIDKYNNVLLTLAEGKSVDALQSAAGGFVEAAGQFLAVVADSSVPGLSSVGGIVEVAVGQFEKARLRAEFEKAVRDGAPVVDRMLVALMEDRNEHLTLRAVEANLNQARIINDITTDAQSVVLLYRGCRCPDSDDPRPDTETALNETLQPVAQALAFKLPIELAYQAGETTAPVLGSDQQIIAQQTMARMVERIAAFQANVEQFESLKSALNSYGTLLQETRTALKILVNALDEPQEFEVMSEEFFAVAFAVKREVEAFRAARKSAP